MSESIFTLEVGLHRLMAQRDDLIESLPMALTTDEQVRIGNAIEVLEGQIRDHAKPTAMAKVDNFVSYYRHREMLRDAARKEKQRQAANEKAEDDILDFMKRIARTTMDEIGRERLEGKLGVIRLQTNGGVEPPPLVSQPDLVPDDLCVFEGKLSYALYCAVLNAKFTWDITQELCSVFSRVPSPALIRAELEKPCSECKGNGVIEDCPHGPGCCGICLVSNSRGTCQSCGGSGKGSVPGCSLQQRQKHVRIS